MSARSLHVKQCYIVLFKSLDQLIMDVMKTFGTSISSEGKFLQGQQNYHHILSSDSISNRCSCNGNCYFPENFENDYHIPINVIPTVLATISAWKIYAFGSFHITKCKLKPQWPSEKGKIERGRNGLKFLLNCIGWPWTNHFLFWPQSLICIILTYYRGSLWKWIR